MKKAISLVNFGSTVNRLKTKRNHHKYQRGHFVNRFRERFGYTLTDDGYNEILAAVKRSGRFLYRREDGTGSTYGVKFRNENIKVVYDAFTETLITIVPTTYGQRN